MVIFNDMPFNCLIINVLQDYCFLFFLVIFNESNTFHQKKPPDVQIQVSLGGLISIMKKNILETHFY
jgi:hypothetical protein